MSDKLQFVDCRTFYSGHDKLKFVGQYIKKAATRAALRNSFCCRSFHDYDPFIFVKLRQHHFDYLTLLCRHELADVVRLTRQFAVLVAAIDQYRKLHSPRPAKIDQLIEGGP